MWATCPNPGHRNPAKALDYAQHACELTAWQDASCLDTLAAAYAACDRFAEAARRGPVEAKSARDVVGVDEGLEHPHRGEAIRVRRSLGMPGSGIGGGRVHGQAEELARYIGNRSVTCQPAPGSANMNCLVDGRDLSEVVLFNGGGRAAPEASPELVAAEDHARSERLGVWKR